VVACAETSLALADTCKEGNKEALGKDFSGFGCLAVRCPPFDGLFYRFRRVPFPFPFSSAWPFLALCPFPARLRGGSSELTCDWIYGFFSWFQRCIHFPCGNGYALLFNIRYLSVRQVGEVDAGWESVFGSVAMGRWEGRGVGRGRNGVSALGVGESVLVAGVRLHNLGVTPPQRLKY